MEPVGAGASVLTFAAVALSTAKFVYDRLSWIKDGPPSVARTASAIWQFRLLLQQIKQQDTTGTDSALLSEAELCTADLDELAAKVIKLQIMPGERAGGKLWKRLKVFVSEKDLDKISETISRHCGLLNLYLSSSTRSGNLPNMIELRILTGGQ